MAARIVFVDEQNIDEVFVGEESDLDEETSDSERSEGEGDRSDEENNSEEESEEEKKKAKKTTGLLAASTREGSTSQVIRAFACSFQRIRRSRTSLISSSLITYLMR